MKSSFINRQYKMLDSMMRKAEEMRTKGIREST